MNIPISNVKLTSDEARDAVNVFAAVDVLGLLEHTGYGGQKSTIEEQIKNYYLSLSYIPMDLKNLGKQRSLQEWDEEKEKYTFSGIWDEIIKLSQHKYKIFRSTSGGADILSKYVRLIANRGDTQGWILEVDGSDLYEEGGVKYLTEAYNLSVKAKPEQWIRWWGHSMSPFSAIQCVIEDITRVRRPEPLPELINQHNQTITYQFPSGNIGSMPPEYITAQTQAYSRLGQLSPGQLQKIKYDIKFNMVDTNGDIIAAFQVDPEIIVVSD
ncbi:hypothetical protein [Moorena sp. SIO3A2]|uniref:hypothetical protein n=1 Tax=Moorena sp. SIO3A2 TaxID=2607841 RepID=UPI0013BE09A6|nr:hypothetical protein [Moorena sp. SIO3A2]NER87131.1 hypothetical protein [Moorena sp. SIO3A2]